MMPAPRVSCCNLSPDEARKLFASNILAASPVDTLFAYSKVSMRGRPVWHGLLPHRAMLMDAFKLSRGRLINQKQLQAHLVLFITSCKKQSIIKAQKMSSTVFVL